MKDLETVKFRKSLGFFDTGNNEKRYFLERCYNCEGFEKDGRENYTPMVASGRCAWCGYNPEKDL